MSEWEHDALSIRRILVALDASKDSLAALEAAAKLAVRLEAELIGLFVEDINLLRLAGLPGAREVSYPSATEQPLDSPKMERHLKMQADQARQALAAAAEQVQVRWSFRVARGQVTAELLAAALQVDLLSLGRASWPLTRRVRLGSTAREVVTRASGAVLLLRNGMRVGQRVVVSYDGSPLARRALATAARLTQTGIQGELPTLTVLIVASTVGATQRLAAEVTAWLSERGVQARYRNLAGEDILSLARSVQLEECGLLVVGGQVSALGDEVIQELLNNIDCPILLIR